MNEIIMGGNRTTGGDIIKQSEPKRGSPEYFRNLHNINQQNCKWLEDHNILFRNKGYLYCPMCGKLVGGLLEHNLIDTYGDK